MVQAAASAERIEIFEARLRQRVLLGRAAFVMSTCILMSTWVRNSQRAKIDRVGNNPYTGSPRKQRKTRSIRAAAGPPQGRYFFSRVFADVPVEGAAGAMGLPGLLRITRPGGENSSTMLHRKARANTVSFTRLTFASPASSRCICRGESGTSSASSSCVTPRSNRSSTMRSPSLASIRSVSAVGTWADQKTRPSPLTRRPMARCASPCVSRPSATRTLFGYLGAHWA